LGESFKGRSIAKGSEEVIMRTSNDITSTTIATPQGDMLLAATPRGLCGAWFIGQKYFPEDSTNWESNSKHAVLVDAREALERYFRSPADGFDLPLDLTVGTEFQQQVWRALLRVKPGSTLSYGQLASQLKRPNASRAVGAAVGRNPISVVVPCHRVVGGNGSLTGYAGGVERKAALLKLEGALL
jgi:methylated-DNA-[protein]-cysteine S-methyltransferase